jgi:predicted nucleotidyltransferase component of viral defense system
MNLKDSRHFKEAKLMLETIPSVAAEECFALKGGTAINFFVRDMPRLSVDLDLTYLPIDKRQPSLGNISDALKRIADRITKLRPSIQAGLVLLRKTKYVTKLTVTERDTQIKIEPNLVLRGTLFPIRVRDTSQKVEEAFKMATSIKTVADADLYGGKICAALDRQHPRDLFDVKLLFENEGITTEIRKGFVVYLAGHDETMSELLDPQKKDLRQSFKDEFEGMTLDRVELHDLLEVRDKLIATLRRDLTEDERKFLLSIKEGSPKWDLLEVKGANKLPAIQWKLMNIAKMTPIHHKKSVNRLKAILEL